MESFCAKVIKSAAFTEEIGTNTENHYKNCLKGIFNHLRREENELGISHIDVPIMKIVTKSMEIEQIWQQLELQNQKILSMSKLDANTLWYKVANLSSKMNIEEPCDSSSDEGVASGEDSEELDSDSKDDGDLGNEDASDEAFDKEDDVDELDNDLQNLQDSDFDADTFGDIVAEGDESDVSIYEDNMNDSEDEEVIQDKISTSQKYAATSLDTKFFNLRESENISDRDLIGDDNVYFDDVDFMSDMNDASDEESGINAKYEDFFDSPIEDTNVESKGKEGKSTFELHTEKEKKLIDDLEAETISDKPWFLKGEVQKDQRPENSTLEEHLSHNIAVKEKPIISDDITTRIERLILSRINTKAWDDVERKSKPASDPFQYKKSLILDQEKSKKSLAEIYEEEYLKLQDKSTNSSGSGPSLILGGKLSAEEELPEHKKIKDAMDDLFTKLDALSNYHYTPKFRNTELKIVSNLPSISVEETTPAMASDATLLAPEEVVVPLRGDPKAIEEKTTSDKKRERRKKKIHQKYRAKQQGEKLKNQMKKRSKDGLAPTSASIKSVEKALKKGQVKVLEPQEKAAKSSTAFFQQLQESVSSKKRKSIGDKPNPKKKKTNVNSVGKLLL